MLGLLPVKILLMVALGKLVGIELGDRSAAKRQRFEIRPQRFPGLVADRGGLEVLLRQAGLGRVVIAAGERCFVLPDLVEAEAPCRSPVAQALAPADGPGRGGV